MSDTENTPYSEHDSDHNDLSEEAGVDPVSSLVTDACTRLRHLEDELRGRLRAVARREAEAGERERALGQRDHELAERANALDERQADLHTREQALDERSSAFESAMSERESQVSRREEVAGAFLEMLAHMHTALQDLQPEQIMNALESGASYEESATAAKQAIGLTSEEQKAFFAARGAGKSDEEILAEIYKARDEASRRAA